MLGVRAISCTCITRFAERKGAVVFEAKILSVDLNAYSKMKTMKYLSFILETGELANIFACGMSHFYLWELSRNYRPGLLEAWLALLNHC